MNPSEFGSVTFLRSSYSVTVRHLIHGTDTVKFCYGVLCCSVLRYSVKHQRTLGKMAPFLKKFGTFVEICKAVVFFSTGLCNN